MYPVPLGFDLMLRFGDRCRCWKLQEEIFKLGAVAGGRFEKYNIPFENLKL